MYWSFFALPIARHLEAIPGPLADVTKRRVTQTAWLVHDRIGELAETEPAFTEVLADLRHIAAAHGLDFDDLARQSLDIFDNETGR